MLRYMAIVAGVGGCLFLGGVSAGDYSGWRGHDRDHGGWDFKRVHKKDAGLTFEAKLTGAQEVTNPPGGVETDRRARGTASFDEGLTRVRVRVRFNDAEGVVAAHFHCGTAGQNGPVAFGLISPGPLGIENDTIKGTLTNADYTGADCMAVVGRPINNIASLAAAMREGLVYLNVHTPDFPGGEVRGQMLED